MSISNYLRKPLMKYSVNIYNKKIFTRNICNINNEKYDLFYKNPMFWVAIISFTGPLYVGKRLYNLYNETCKHLYNEKYPEKH